MRIRVVPEGDDQFVPIEDRVHDAPLNAAAAAVDQPHFGEPAPVRRMQVLGDDRGNVARREGVQVEFGIDRDDVGRGVGCHRVGPNVA